MKLEQKRHEVQTKTESEKAKWNAPDVVELELKETATGGAGATDGLDPGS